MRKIFTLLSIAFAVQAFSQIKKTIPEMTVASPEIASLGRYGDMDVDHYTGTANVSVPLHTIDFAGLQIPINLSYNTGGIKVDQEATWVGLGWNLSAQPTITRQINGLSDINEGSLMTSELTGYPYTSVAFPEYAYGVSDDLKMAIDSNIKNFFDYNIKQGTNSFDTQPDIFSVNLFGESVKFVLTQKAFNNGVIEGKSLNPDYRVKITFDEQNKNFTVTNDKGFVFYFDVKEFSITGAATSNEGEVGTYMNMGQPGQQSVRVIPGYDQKIISGWHVSKVVSPSNEIISFNYSARTFIDDQPKTIWSEQIMACAYTGYTGQDVSPSDRKLYEGFITQHDLVYLSSIVTDREEILFTTSGRQDLVSAGTAPYYTIYGSIMGGTHETPKKMDALIVKNRLGGTVKNYGFSYTYFNSTNTNVINNWNPKVYLRLKLDAITYNTEFYRSFSYISPESLPSKLSMDQDHWGFYNGKGNSSRIPTNKVNAFCSADFPDRRYPVQKLIQFFGADKDANFNFGKNGLLQKINYPTKGYTTFNYEGNSVVIDRSPVGDKYPLVDYENIEITSKFVSSPVSSPVIHLTDRFTEPGILTFSCGSEFMEVPSSTLSWRKCDVLRADVEKPALQMINADTGAIVFTKIFSSDVYCSAGYSCEPLSVPNGVISFPIILQGIPEGNYYFRVRASHEPSNALDEEEGVYPGTGNPDYFKPYFFAVRFSLKIPKDALYEHYNKVVGGARIESITNFDHNNALIDKKKFRYEKSFAESLGANLYSSGLLMNDLAYHNFAVIDNLWTGLPPLDYTGELVNCIRTGYSSKINYIYFNSDSQVLSPETAKGRHLGYSHVEEILISNLDSSNNGKITYEFSNKKNFHKQDLSHGGETFRFPAYIDNNIYAQNYAAYPMETYEHLNGDLVKKTFYNSSSDKVKEMVYKYMYHDYYPTLNIGVYGGIMKNYSRNLYNCFLEYTNSVFSPFEFQPYKIKNEMTPVVEISETDYFLSGEINKTVKYEYNGSYSVKKITEENGTSVRTTENLYAGDSGASAFPFVASLAAKNIINTPLQSKHYLDGELIEKNDNIYGSFNNNTLIAISKIISAKGNGTSSDFIEYQKYDEKGNLLQFRKPLGTYSSFILGYKKSVPVAKIENLAYDDIAISLISDIQSKSDSGNEQELLAALNSLRALYPHAMVTAYTYKPLVGITSSIDPKGMKTTYEYDSFGRLKFVKDHDGKVLSQNQYHYKL